MQSMGVGPLRIIPLLVILLVVIIAFESAFYEDSSRSDFSITLSSLFEETKPPETKDNNKLSADTGSFGVPGWWGI